MRRALPEPEPRFGQAPGGPIPEEPTPRHTVEARSALRDFAAAARTPGGQKVAEAFARAARQGRAALVGYWPAGYPDLERSERALLAMADGGCDLLEVGVPFSDPVADGPVLQEAASVALRRGTSLPLALELAGRVQRLAGKPTVLMSYYNPLMQFGEVRLAREMARQGLSGLIVPDLPVEEARVLVQPLRDQGLAWVALVAPTSAGRLRRIAAEADGFIYAVSRTGVTGMSGELPAETRQLLGMLAEVSQLPVAVGFGIATPDQAASCRQADGVVVGTAFVEAYRRAAQPGRTASGGPQAAPPTGAHPEPVEGGSVAGASADWQLADPAAAEQAVRELARCLRAALVRPSG